MFYNAGGLLIFNNLKFEQIVLIGVIIQISLIISTHGKNSKYGNVSILFLFLNYYYNVYLIFKWFSVFDLYRPDYRLSCFCAYNLRRSVRRLEESTTTTDFAMASFTIFVDIYWIFLLVIFGNWGPASKSIWHWNNSHNNCLYWSRYGWSLYAVIIISYSLLEIPIALGFYFWLVTFNYYQELKAKDEMEQHQPYEKIAVQSYCW